MSAALGDIDKNIECGSIKVKKEFWPSDYNYAFQSSEVLNNNETKPIIEDTSKLIDKDVEKQAKSQLWTRQSFINMYIQSKYLELLAKNQTYMSCVKQFTDTDDSQMISPPQERPLDLSTKSVNGSSEMYMESSLKGDINIFNERQLMSFQNLVQSPLLVDNTFISQQMPELTIKNPTVTSSTSQFMKAFSCSVCGQSFNLQDRLAKHIASCHKQKKKQNDTGRTYECEICKRSFARSDMLTRHSRLHTGLKPYTCSVCRQVFSRSDHLSTHQRTHTGEKPYKCPHELCQYAACRRDMINRHMRTHLRQDSKLVDVKETTHKIKTSYDLILNEIKSEL